MDSGASAGFGGRCGLLQSSRTFGYGESGGGPKRIVAGRRAAPQRAVWQRARPITMLLRNVVSIQRRSRVIVGGDIGYSNRWLERSYGANRVVSSAASRTGRAPRSSNHRFRSSHLGTSVQGRWPPRERGPGEGATRGTRWLSERGEGLFRPEPSRQRGRAGPGREPCEGEAARLACRGRYRGRATPSSSRIRAVAVGLG